jgi:NADPH-dependent 2,4-dienoyl-CoA reductase/sulfur reductase-like enzyme
MTLAEIKKELKKYKDHTVKAILVDENEGEHSIDVIIIVKDVYGNYDREYITIEGFETEAAALKRAKLLGAKLNAKVEIANC